MRIATRADEDFTANDSKVISRTEAGNDGSRGEGQGWITLATEAMAPPPLLACFGY